MAAGVEGKKGAQKRTVCPCKQMAGDYLQFAIYTGAVASPSRPSHNSYGRVPRFRGCFRCRASPPGPYIDRRVIVSAQRPERRCNRVTANARRVLHKCVNLYISTVGDRGARAGGRRTFDCRGEPRKLAEIDRRALGQLTDGDVTFLAFAGGK